ncbi:MAG: hypothetical protein IT477_10765 [Rhodanobacteraceae bacterium]|nr:hypothetical protein [Rhodanobacteraceae bacterium]
MPRPCSVCSHPKRGEIDQALARGEPNRSIALGFALSIDSVKRHRSNHLAGTIAKANRAAERKVAAVVEEKIEREQIRSLDTMTELQNIFDSMNRMLDACDAWLTDPDNPTQYELGPRAHEVNIVYESKIGEKNDGTPILSRRKEPLSVLIAKVEKHWQVDSVLLVEHKSADPRKLIIDTANQLRSNIELLARIQGQITESAEQINIVNLLVVRPEVA